VLICKLETREPGNLSRLMNFRKTNDTCAWTPNRFGTTSAVERLMSTANAGWLAGWSKTQSGTGGSREPPVPGKGGSSYLSARCSKPKSRIGGSREPPVPRKGNKIGDRWFARTACPTERDRSYLSYSWSKTQFGTGGSREPPVPGKGVHDI